MIRQLSVVVTALAALATPPALAAQALTSAQHDAITEIFDDLSDPRAPGASVAVIRDGTIVYSEGFGSAQIEYGIPVTPSTVFHVASVSKQFTAMAVLLLEADGEFSIEDDVSRHMRGVPDMGSPVTVRQLLHHTSGVRDQWELLAMAGWRLDDVITKVHVRHLLANQRELNFEPGSEYLYSNMGYSILADLSEQVSGMPFSDFLEERVFSPLGMDHTHVHDDHEHVVPGRAYSYRTTEDGFEKAVLSYANHGATSLFTTAEDLVKWLDNFRHHRVGGAAVLDKMTTRGVLTSGDTISYALGVTVGEYRGAATVGHGGADAGFRSSVIWFPEHATGIAVLSNLASGNPGGRAMRVADVVLEHVLEPRAEPEEPQAPQGPAVSEEAEESVMVRPEILAMYAGRFRTAVALIEFEVRDGILWSVSPEEAELIARSPLEFGVPGADVSVTFHPDAAGSADSLTLTMEGRAIRGFRVPEVVYDTIALQAYTGVYYSPEIETFYHIYAVEDGLVAHHLRHGEIVLTPDAVDSFTSPRWFFQHVRFTRGSDGAVEGLRVTGGRVRNLRFVKIPGGLPGHGGVGPDS